MKRSIPNAGWAILASVLGPAAAHGQWVDRSFEIEPGWNSVFLDIDPAPAEADLLFAGEPISAVWTWEHDALIEGPPDCASPDDPSCVPAPNSGWYVWLPPGDPGRVTTTLRLIRGGQIYLIRATRATTLQVTGVPSADGTEWRRGFNLVGFHVVDNPAEAPTFASYLAPSSAHAATAAYDVQPDGSLAQVADLTGTRIPAGHGFWVKSDQDIKYDGPVVIDNGSLRGVDFDKSLLEHSVTLENLAASPCDVTLTYAASAPAPAVFPGPPALAGDVPLSWFDYGAEGLPEDMLQWRPFTTEDWQLDGSSAPGARATVRLGVNRTGLPGAVVDLDGQGSEYQGLIEVTDGHGFLRRLPVTAQVLPAAGAAAAAGGSEPAGAGSAIARPGLYLGRVMVDQVAWITAGARIWTEGEADDPVFAGTMHCFGGDNDGQVCFPDRRRCMGLPEIERTELLCEDDADCPGVTTCETVTDCPGGTCRPFCVAEPTTPCNSSTNCPTGSCSAETNTTALRPTPAEFIFPVIVHLSDSGEYKMLTEVTMMWQPDSGVPDTPGRYVLATPECPPEIFDQLLAGSIQDGQPFTLRAATAAFSFDGDLPLSGGFETFLAGETIVEQDHPLNPFRHRNHPDHDGLNSLGVPVEGECYEITRSFLLITDPPPDEPRPGWGDSLWTGAYVENLEGLHKETIAVGGRFELNRVSTIPTLNAQ